MSEKVKLVHGNGGRFSHELLETYILPHFKNEWLGVLHDGAQFPVQAGRMAFTTDSYVVTPYEFPGGNIGKLAICGTVNDLAMNGAIPQYISCALILEEGFELKQLEAILSTMEAMAAEAQVQIVTGDTKVVEKGSIDGIFINTAGIGMIPDTVDSHPKNIKPGMKVIVTGTLGDHAIAVMGTRYGLSLAASIQTDCAPLNGMIQAVLEKVGKKVAVLRDPTRGGLGTTLCELAQQSQTGILIEEEQIPVTAEVKSVCSILGYDAIYLANEGKAILIVEADVEEEVLSILHTFKYGKAATTIGTVISQNKGKVGLRTTIGGIRIIEPLGEDQVPRIC